MGRVRTYARFELGRVVRSWKFLLVTVGFPAVFYLLFLGNHAPDHPVDGSVPWRLYLMVAMCSFGSMVAGLNASGGRLSVERANGWARQLRVTPLPAWSYLATKVVVGMVVALPVVVLVEALGAGAGGVRLGAGTWVGLTVLLWLLSLPFAVLGVLVGFAVHPETVYPVITALMFVLGYFGGLFSPVDALPAVLRTVAHGLPSYQQAALGLDVATGHAPAAGGWLVVVLFVAVPWALVLWRHRVEEARGVA
jgi:ABC-2 type transport system permease protein